MYNIYDIDSLRYMYDIRYVRIDLCFDVSSQCSGGHVWTHAIGVDYYFLVFFRVHVSRIVVDSRMVFKIHIGH